MKRLQRRLSSIGIKAAPCIHERCGVARRCLARRSASNTSVEVERCTIDTDLEVPRLLVGMWQVSGAHGFRVEPKKAVQAMREHYDKGLYAFDMADHYGSAEDLYGIFKASVEGQTPYGFTKWVPRPQAMTKQVVEKNIDISLSRMQVDGLDMMQFHWWDYNDKRFIDALKHMSDMREEGKIKVLSLTNFNTENVQYIVDQGIPIKSNQVSYSILDRRPEKAMAPYCEANGIKLLTYGTLLGGFLSDEWLGKSEPNFWFSTPTASQGKYKQFIDRWGGWNKFQDLLRACNTVAKKHDVSISNVAVRYILQKPAVGSCIIGTRLGHKENISDNLKVFGFELDEDDMALLDEMSSRGELKADCGDEYRGIPI